MPSSSTSTPAPPVSGKALLFIFVVVFLDLLGAGILLPIIPYYVRPFRSDALTVSLLYLSFSAAQFVASPILGVLSDRYGRRPVLLLSILGSAAGYFLFGIAGSLFLMFFARILDGFTGGNISTAQAYIADVSRPEDRGKNFGLIGAAFGLGFIIGPALGGLLSTISIQAPPYAAGVLSLLTATFGYFVLPESLPPAHRRVHAIELADLNPIRPIFQALSRQSLRLMLLSIFLLNFSFGGLQANFALFTLVRFEFTPQQNAWIFTFIGLCAAITQGLIVRRLSPILGERRLSLIGLAILTAGFVLISVSYAKWMLYLAVVLVSGVGLASPSQIALLSHRVSSREQGWLLGTTQSLVSLTRVLGPIWAGWTFDVLGTGSPYSTGALLLLGALGLNWMATKMEK
ncbi:MAG: MFS transporter [Bryobacteraceae bacterium]|nr:MFS transporter [Bryobacteraceae bacterium]